MAADSSSSSQKVNVCDRKIENHLSKLLKSLNTHPTLPVVEAKRVENTRDEGYLLHHGPSSADCESAFLKPLFLFRFHGIPTWGFLSNPGGNVVFSPSVTQP
jgi:hypothetical protein